MEGGTPIRLHCKTDHLSRLLVPGVRDNFCDVSLISEDRRTVMVHSWVMARSSSLLSSLLREVPRCQCRDLVRVTVAGVSGDILTDIVSLIYSGEATLRSDAANELIENAKVLGINNIATQQKQEEHKNIMTDNEDLYTPGFDTYNNQSDDDETDDDEDSPEVNDKIDRLLQLVSSENVKEDKELDALVSDIFSEKEQPKYHKVTGEKKLKWDGKGKKPTNHNLSKICPKCGKDYTSYKRGRNLMLKHYKEVHEGEGQHICPECGKFYTHLHKMKAHMRSVHRPLIHCDQCDYKCYQSSNLNTHKAYNHTERNIICDQCSKAFPLKSALEKHIRTVHEGFRIKCPDCDFQTTTKQNLKKHHDMIHLLIKFPCSMCSKEYSNQSALNTHSLKEHGINLKKYKKIKLADGKICLNKDVGL